MKIKLTRALWNNPAGSVLELSKDKCDWAVWRGAAEYVKEKSEPKAQKDKAERASKNK